jgi:hypothetical protein
MEGSGAEHAHAHAQQSDVTSLCGVEELAPFVWTCPVPISKETRDAPFFSSTTSATGFPIVNALREIGNVNVPLARMDKYLGWFRDLPVCKAVRKAVCLLTQA